MILGEFTQDTLREIKLDSQNRVFKINSFLDCGAANVANPTFPFECDNPMDMQFGADGSFYLLTYGDGFFNVNPDAGMYRWDYVKGQRAPKAVLTTDRTDGPLPLTVNFSSAGSLDDDPGDSIRYEWDFGDGSPISDRGQPDAHLHQGGPLHGGADGDRLLGRADLDEHDHHGGQHQPDGGRRRAARRRHCSPSATRSSTRSRSPIREDPAINCNDVAGDVRARPRHARPCRAEQRPAARGFLQTDADDVSHGGNVFGVISATLHRQGRLGRRLRR